MCACMCVCVCGCGVFVCVGVKVCVLITVLIVPFQGRLDPRAGQGVKAAMGLHIKT
jgi:hypothetical protein